MNIIGFGKDRNWVKEFFIDKGYLFLRVLNAKWKTSKEETKLVVRLLKTLGVDQGSKILDLGCGNGRIAINLAKHGYYVVGVDISPIFIEDAQKKAKEYNVEDKVKFLVGDALELDKILKDKVFDATIMYWSTIIGYYLDKDKDIKVLENIRRITRNEGYLLILNTVSLDVVALRAGLFQAEGCLNEVDEEMVLIEKPRFDPKTSIIENTWIFYRRRGKDLEYLNEISFKLRVYALHELIEITEKAGWRFIEAYRDLLTLRPYRPMLSNFNVVFKAA